MLAIEVEFLMGRAILSHGSRRDAVEWPPHPQRLFSALTATHFERDLGDASEAALKWLENLSAPELCVDLKPGYRSTLSHWVPVNDESVRAEKGIDFRHILDRRNRQERFFPAAIPRDPTIVFQWPSSPGLEGHRTALATLVAGLYFLGHSSSPVCARLRNEPVNPNLVPSESGEYTLRVPGPGRFARLREVHELRIKDESIQPPLGRVQSYSEPARTVASVFDTDAVVLAFSSGPRLSLDSTLPLMQQLRSAVLAKLGNGAPEVLCGHDKSGRSSVDPHLVLAPLAYIIGKHADGSLKGAALILPRSADQEARRKLARALSSPLPLHLGPLGSIQMHAIERSQAVELRSLQFDSYTHASRCWASVTPVVLDRHPKKRGPTLESIVSDSCRRIGLPDPVEVRSGDVSAHKASPRARDFHGQAKQTDGRPRAHVILRFDQPVRGPVVIGAGRFFGLGLCLPFNDAGA